MPTGKRCASAHAIGDDGARLSHHRSATALPAAAGGDAGRRRVAGGAAARPRHAALVQPRPQQRAACWWPTRCRTRSPRRCTERQSARLAPLFDRAVQDERLFAIGLCEPAGRMLQSSARYPRTLDCRVAPAPGRAGRAAPRLAGGAGARRRARRLRADAPTDVAGSNGDAAVARPPGAAARPELRRRAQPGHAALPDRPDRRRSASSSRWSRWWWRS